MSASRETVKRVVSLALTAALLAAGFGPEAYRACAQVVEGPAVSRPAVEGSAGGAGVVGAGSVDGTGGLAVVPASLEADLRDVANPTLSQGTLTLPSPATREKVAEGRALTLPSPAVRERVAEGRVRESLTPPTAETRVAGPVVAGRTQQLVVGSASHPTSLTPPSPSQRERETESMTAAGSDFDGGKTRPGYAFGAAVNHAEDPEASRPGGSGLSTPTSPGQTAETLAFPPVPAGPYRAPGRITWTRRVYLTLHWAGLAAALAALLVGLGWPAFAVGAGAYGWRFYNFLRAYRAKGGGATAFSGTLYGEKQLVLQNRGETLLKILVARLGLPEDRAPAFEVSNGGGGAFSAASRGDAVDSSAQVALGEGYLGKAIQETAAILAHELGHLYAGDFGWSRILRNRHGLRFLVSAVESVARVGLGAKAVVLLLVGILPLVPALAALAFIAMATDFQTIDGGWLAAHPKSRDTVATLLARGPAQTVLKALLAVVFALTFPTALWAGLGVTALAFPLVVIGALFGIAVWRQEEHRADHFGAWLTRSEWMAIHFRKAPNSRPLPRLVRLRERFISTHPTGSSRLRRMERLTRQEQR